MKKYSLWQRFWVQVNGRAYLGYKLLPRQDHPVKIYLAKCPAHGYFEDTLHGFEPDDYMNCPECLKERIHD